MASSSALPRSSSRGRPFGLEDITMPFRSLLKHPRSPPGQPSSSTNMSTIRPPLDGTAPESMIEREPETEFPRSTEQPVH